MRIGKRPLDVFGKLRRQLGIDAGDASAGGRARRRQRDRDLHAAGAFSARVVEAGGPSAGAEAEDQAMSEVTRRIAGANPLAAHEMICRFYAARREESRKAALLLALRCGGPEAGQFLGELLEGGPIHQEERHLALRALPFLESSHRLVIDEALAERAYAMTRSADLDERKGGAGLLGTQDTPRARERLMEMAEADPEPSVRTAALRMLGQNGDQTTLAYLKAYPLAELSPGACEALTGALWKLEKKQVA